MADITKSQANDLTLASNPSPLRAKYFSVVSPEEDRYQFEKAVEAFRQAGMPFSIIANVGEELGYQVERGEVEAALLENAQIISAQSGAEKKEDMMLAFQKRGEVVDEDRLLASAESSQALVPVSQALMAPQNSKVIEVIEGIAIYKEQLDELNPQNNSNKQLTGWVGEPIISQND
jgi:hypothetical protein